LAVVVERAEKDRGAVPDIVVDGVTISYSDTGEPPEVANAPTVVFGHGLLFGGSVFEHQIARLRSRYRCIALDWRGQGDSPPTVDGYDMDTLTEDAVGFIRALGVAPVHWVGLSMGGFVGLRIGARHGEILRSLTLLNTSAHAEDPDKQREYKRLAWAQQLIGFRTIAPMVTQHLFGPSYRTDPHNRPHLKRWSRAVSERNSRGVRKAVYGVAGRAGVDHEIAAITVPTLVLVGADDSATPPEEARYITSLIPGAQHRVIADCGHTSTLEQPDTVTELLGVFLASVVTDEQPVRSKLSPPETRARGR
jgi:pimeloyl-ACP methyl ester carboxylesterase